MSIEHDSARARFSVALVEGLAWLDYRKTDVGAWDIVSVYVPPAARGRGCGEALVHAAMAVARSQDVTVLASCPFARVVLERMPGTVQANRNEQRLRELGLIGLRRSS